VSTEDVARSYFEAAAARDPDRMASHWAAEGVDDLVPIGILRGPDEVRAFFTEFFAAVPDFEFVVERVTADGRVAAVQWRASGTFDGGPFQGVDPTGRRIELRGCDCVEVEDRKLVRNTAYWDNMAFARGVGMMPPLDSPAERAMKRAFNSFTKLRGALR
jgi:steroid delta-isomerase-like uncharacterized protein